MSDSLPQAGSAPTPTVAGRDATAPAALTERRGNVLIVTINRPHARNAVNSAVSTAVGDALQEAQDDSEVRAVVITGAGNHSAPEPISK